MNTRRRLLLLGTAFIVLVAACADTDQGVVSSRSEGVEATDPDVTEPATTDPDVTDPSSSDPGSTTVDTGSVDTSAPPVTGDTVPVTEVPTDPTNPAEPPPDPTLPLEEAPQVVDVGDKAPQEYDEYLNAAFADVIDFWHENYPVIYGTEFVDVSGIYAHTPERQPLPDSCAGEIAYEEVEFNAFYFTCDRTGVDLAGDVIVYDDAQLLPDLVEKLGIAAVAVVAAHEFGHAVQARAGILGLGLPTVETEQQADCFAGAWTGHMARGESTLLPQFGDDEVKGGLAAMIEVRDQPGSDPLAPGGHGNAFDRVGAFQEGFISGVERCEDFLENPNPRIDLIFTEADIETGGDLPLDEVLELIPPSFDVFWVPTLEASGVPFTPPALAPFPTDGPYPECAGLSGGELKNRAVFCPETNTIAYDEDFVVDLYNLLGDVAFTYPLVVAYSDAVQAALGFQLSGEPKALLSDCLVGAWLVDITPDPNTGNANNPNQEVLLSAGDLDEVVQIAVLFGDAATSTNLVGTAFEKIEAFRAGVQRGLEGCQARLG